MAIVIDKEHGIFTLHTGNTTYQMMVGTYGHLLHLYYGRQCEGNLDYLLTYHDRGFSGNPYDAGKERTYSMDALPQEFSSYGNGDFRSPAFILENADGTFCADLRYVDCEISEGKYQLPGLPAVYDEKKEAQTLIMHLKDVASGVGVKLYYGIVEELDVITRAACICNEGQTTVQVRKAASMALDFLEGDYELLHFHGRHGMERICEKSVICHDNQVFGSRRGASSHQQNPFFVVAAAGTTEDAGDCYGFHLMYSGNFKAEAEKDQYEQTRILLGMSDELFSWELQPGECFYTPEAVLSHSAVGLGQLSANFHTLIRKHVCRGSWRDVRRPVLINNWEATYFDFTGEKIVEIAREAAKLGVELLVLDDGWFGKRNDDYAGLGDWFVNEQKLGGSLLDVAEKVRSTGMKFGFWIEPEMVSEDSELYRAHPDWAFVIPGRKPVRGRYQLVLDFSRKEVVDYIYERIAAVIEETKASYIKMDMNRHLTDIYSHGADCQNQGAILHRYVLGVYEFLERLHLQFPELLIEGCAGGGGRFDGGMLYYTPQIWCSDNTDAMARIRIQYGTSFGYPVSAVGSHVSAVPNHQTGRTTPFETRGVVAMAGSFGYELDLSRITEQEKALVCGQIAAYKKYWHVIQEGRYFRLTDPWERRMYTAWEFVDEEMALLCVVAQDTQCNPATSYVHLKGLEPEAVYRMEETGEVYMGAALMYAGIPVPRMENEYVAWQVCFLKIHK